MRTILAAPRLGGFERLEPRCLMAALAVDAAAAIEVAPPPLLLPASVAGRLFVDDNGDGVRQSGEIGCAAAAIELTDAAGRTVAATVTDEHGCYDFPTLAPGSYVVRAMPADAPARDAAGEGNGVERHVLLHPGDAVAEYDLAAAPRRATATAEAVTGQILFGYRPTPAIEWPRPAAAAQPEASPPRWGAPAPASVAPAARQEEPVFGGSSRWLDERASVLEAGELDADLDESPAAELAAAADPHGGEHVAQLRRRHAARDRAFADDDRREGTVGIVETPVGDAPAATAPSETPPPAASTRVAAWPAA